MRLNRLGRRFGYLVLLALALALPASCTGGVTAPPITPMPTAVSTTVPASTRAGPALVADVTAVAVRGEPSAYQFSVTVASPDTGCDQFVDWWEILSEDGALLYRRVLLHSHVDEQPFTRSGGPVAIAADTVVFIRAHMNVGGYGGAALQGTVTGGFEPVTLAAGFAAEVEAHPPQPEGCAF